MDDSAAAVARERARGDACAVVLQQCRKELRDVKALLRVAEAKASSRRQGWRNAKAELERVEYLHALRLRKFEAEVARCCPGLARECLARAEAEWQRTLSHMAVHGVATASAATSSRDAADAFEE